LFNQRGAGEPLLGAYLRLFTIVEKDISQS